MPFQDEKSVLEFLFSLSVSTEDIPIPWFRKTFNNEKTYQTMAFKNWAKIDFQKNSSYTSDFKFSFSLSHGPLTSYFFVGVHTCMCATHMSQSSYLSASTVPAAHSLVKTLESVEKFYSLVRFLAEGHPRDIHMLPA